jgi:hypothetical protein
MLTMLRGGDDNCCDRGKTCPTVFRADDGTLVVQGYITGRPDTVRVPSSLVPEWVDAVPVDADHLLVSGRPVADAAMLHELNLPEGESAVLIEPADVPKLAGVV